MSKQKEMAKKQRTLEAILESNGWIEENRDMLMDLTSSCPELQKLILNLEDAYLELIADSQEARAKAYTLMTLESHPYLSLALTRRNSAIAEFMQAAGIEAKGDAAQQLREVTHKITFGQIKIVTVNPE